MSGQHCKNYDVKRETVHCYPRNVTAVVRDHWNFSAVFKFCSFFICSIKSPQCADKCSKKNFFDSDFPSPCFDVPKASNFTSGGVQNHDTKNRRLGTIVTSIQDSKPREKQISQSSSYCELINLLRNGTIVRCL